MNDIKKIFWETIKILDNNKVLEHVVLIGSWAEYIYEKSGFLRNFEANLKTRDIDFLIRNINKPREGIKLEPYEVPSFGIKAEGLRNTNLLIDNIAVIEVKNIKIAVPTPQAYLLQKIIINNQRKNKAEKDYLGIENLLENIKVSDLEFQKLKDLYTILTKKQKKIIRKFLNDNLFELF